MMHVAAGVLIDAEGRVLLAERPPGKHLAGHWEFPGGKLEPGESVIDALRRELREELAIEAGSMDPAPLIDVPWRHGEISLRLIAHRVHSWQGTPRSCEGQALAWLTPSMVDPATLAPADHHILHALRLPSRYLVTPDLAVDTAVDSVRALLHSAVDHGEKLVQLRLPSWPANAVRDLAAICLPRLRAAGLALLLDGDIEGARKLGTGVHLRASQLAVLHARPVPEGQWVGASCRDSDELRQALAIGADFVVLLPVRPTPAYPDATALGWERLADLIAQTPLPAYAFGGMAPEDETRARMAGAQGVAGIRAFWPGGLGRR